MEIDTATQNGTQEEAGRRKSGRAIRKPDLYSQEDHTGSLLGSTKRKRVTRAPVSDESDGEPDEEEMRELRRARRKRTPAKPATKRARRANGASTTLAIRSANIQSKPLSKAAKVQKARARPSQVNKEGLYAEVFGRNQSAEAAANYWISTVKKDSVAAMRDLINFVFECIGYDASISSSDIEDIDNVPNRLGDILEEYAKIKDADYPLISKARQYTEFRSVLVDFFSAVIKALHNSADLHEHPEIYENIHVWIGTMSGANYRPFRHTATTISLTMTSALCEVAAEIQQSMATAKTQLETEKKKRTTNKARIHTIQESIKADEKKLEAIDAHLRDAFDTVYVHRYRDVAEIIRADCVAALGNWIVSYRKMFLEGQYLRYLGWVMSDPSAATRHEVLKQLKGMFKNQRNIPALRAFTERFRPRMVEMGARDADISVRVEAIELLDRLRGAELLEPADIETVGHLIFDAEPRVRKAVAKFFVANIEDMYAAEVEGFDQELYAEALPEEVDEFTSPQQRWIKFKCLATALSSSSADSESESDENQRSYRPYESDTRYMLATQAIFPHIAELAEWESLAGYLLYDHSSITVQSEDVEVGRAVQGIYKLAAGEEIVLLDVLYFSARIFLNSVAEVAKERKGRANATKAEIRKKQETAAHNLSTIIPQLLSRYGSTPQASTSILRLEQLLDADLINETPGEAAYEQLLEDVHKQFVTHSDQEVLAEATKALRTARSYEQSKEATDAKVLELWQDARDTLLNIIKGKNVERRGTLDRSVLAEVLNRVVRLSNLASVSDCTEVLESKVRSKRQKERVQHETLLHLLMDLVKRGVPDDETAVDIAESEDQIACAAITTISFYFRWKVVQLKNAIEKHNAESLEADALVGLATQQAAYVEVVLPIIAARLPLEPLRITATLNLLDLFILLATTKNMHPVNGELDHDIRTSISSLSANKLPDDLLQEVMATHEKMERSDDDGGGGGRTLSGKAGRRKKRKAALLAEQALCELTSKLVLACFGGVIDGKTRDEVKARLQVNRTKLEKEKGRYLMQDRMEVEGDEIEDEDDDVQDQDEVEQDDDEDGADNDGPPDAEGPHQNGGKTQQQDEDDDDIMGD
ncbi:hypothetical protein DV736_g4084, partial [Chaetothyriales sp. CBS 134916]